MKTTIIGIAGGTGFGKSTFTNRLKDYFGDKVTVIYHDNYYAPHADLTFKERQTINYDHPDALETDLLVKHLKELREGHSIECPVYDFTQHNRSQETIVIKPSHVIIVEGILIFQSQELRDIFDIKIFVEADADERILRRVLRDMNERGRKLDDIVINSGLNNVAFDIMKTKIEDILKKDAAADEAEKAW